MKNVTRFLCAVLFSTMLIFQANTLFAQDISDISLESELGAGKILLHTYRVGSTADGNTNFNFVTQGGQELLFFYERYTALVLLGGHHEIRFLYQPLLLITDVRFRDAVTVDNITFAPDTPMRLTYSFPFYRLTYQYRFLDNNSGSWLQAGGALQLRNASIRFEQLDGTQLFVSQNLGLVPALAVSGRAELGNNFYASFDITGIYASSAFFNGANFQFEGSILDASVRFGTQVTDAADVFLSLRFLGGSASGISQYARSEWTNSISPETANYLALLSITLGATIK